MSEYEQILETRNQLRNNLSAIDVAIQEQIDELNIQAFESGTPLTPDEKKQRTELRAAQTELGRLFNMLAVVTIARLDKSDRVHKLAVDLKEITLEIQDEIEWLAELDEGFSEASAVATGLNDLAAKINELESFA